MHGNEPRKDNEARKEGRLAGLYSETFEDAGVGCAPQVAFQPPNEYVTMVMKEHHDKLLTSEEFMQATGLSVFKHITETFCTLMYERPDLYVYVKDDMVSWLGFEGDRKHQKHNMLQTLNACFIHYNYLYFEELQKVTHQVL